MNFQFVTFRSRFMNWDAKAVQRVMCFVGPKI